MGEVGGDTESFGEDDVSQGNCCETSGALVVSWTGLARTGVSRYKLFGRQGIAENRGSVLELDTVLARTVFTVLVTIPTTHDLILVLALRNNAHISNTGDLVGLLAFALLLFNALKEASFQAKSSRVPTDIAVGWTVDTFAIFVRNLLSLDGITACELRGTAERVFIGLRFASFTITTVISEGVFRGVRVAIGGQMSQISVTTNLATAGCRVE